MPVPGPLYGAQAVADDVLAPLQAFEHAGDGRLYAGEAGFVDRHEVFGYLGCRGGEEGQDRGRDRLVFWHLRQCVLLGPGQPLEGVEGWLLPALRPVDH